MSYLDQIRGFSKDLSPQLVMETLGLRRREPEVTDLIVPVLAAFGVGCLAGAAVGLLLAPSSGEDLREDIADRASKLADQARDAASNVRARLPGQAMDGATHENGVSKSSVAVNRPRASTASRTYGET